MTHRAAAETVSRFIRGAEFIAEKKKKHTGWSECKSEKKKKKLKELEGPFSILQSVSQTGRRREIRESVNDKEEEGLGKRRRGKKLRFSQQVRLHCKSVSAGNRGPLMVGDNSLITHRFDPLQPSVANVTTAVYCLES